MRVLARRIEGAHWAFVMTVVVTAVALDPLVSRLSYRCSRIGWGIRFGADKTFRFVRNLGYHIHDWVQARLRR
jgi:hypothetical protein